ncbi:hypothetical protein C8R46DRAFT_1243269 [Mycena filopes]|nr:hypothetical protein C8R46DRAFT_1243269 [Mycena filopes]
MAPLRSLGPHSSRLIYTLFTLVSTKLRPLSGTVHVLEKRKSEFDPHDPKSIVFVVLIPVLVLLSGVFAGLTLGYMSLDQTQLNVLCLSGTPEQRKYAKKILPIRQNGHLLLVTLLLANMIVNESLPIIADPILGGGVQSVVVSTVLIIIFAEIIPQSLFTRYGLYLGAKGAPFTRCLIYGLGFIAWPVAKLLEFALGQHHGIIYRRAELKELIAMHSSSQHHGGDLKMDTVTIIGATLDLQEKVVREAMTPIEEVFMLSIESKLDYDLLKKIVATGHSRIPVYEEIDAPVAARVVDKSVKPAAPPQKVKKILGVLLVKQLVLLDPKDAVPLRTVPLNMVSFVPNNQSLLGILDKFQEGRSHIAVRGLTQRLRDKVGMGDSSDSESETEETTAPVDGPRMTRHLRGDGNGVIVKDYAADPEAGVPVPLPAARSRRGSKEGERGSAFQMSSMEASMPADAVLGKADANEFLEGLDPAVNPLGIITLEDVLEELIGEEIFDEFDEEGAKGTYVHHHKHHHPHPAPTPAEKGLTPPPPAGGMRNLNFFRSRSAAPGARSAEDGKSSSAPGTADDHAGRPAVDPPEHGGRRRNRNLRHRSPSPPAWSLPRPPGGPVPPSGREVPVRSPSLPVGGEIPLEAMLRAGARRPGRTGTGNAPRGRFKSRPTEGAKGGDAAAGATDDAATTSTNATTAAAVPIEGLQRTLTPEPHVGSDAPADTTGQ